MAVFWSLIHKKFWSIWDWNWSSEGSLRRKQYPRSPSSSIFHQWVTVLNLLSNPVFRMILWNLLLEGSFPGSGISSAIPTYTTCLCPICKSAKLISRLSRRALSKLSINPQSISQLSTSQFMYCNILYSIVEEQQILKPSLSIIFGKENILKVSTSTTLPPCCMSTCPELWVLHGKTCLSFVWNLVRAWTLL